MTLEELKKEQEKTRKKLEKEQKQSDIGFFVSVASLVLCVGCAIGSSILGTRMQSNIDLVGCIILGIAAFIAFIADVVGAFFFVNTDN